MTHAVSAASKGDAVKPLHNASTADSYADLPFLPAGGVASAKGFKACGIHAGFRADPKRLDFALVAADQPAACAAVFTTNVFCSAPVTVSKEHLDGAGYGIARAVAINSGIANAATGDKGLQTARQSSGIVADALGCPAQEVLVASTGVIGQHLQMEPFESGAPLAVSVLSAAGGADAARAIMTTDTKPKEFAVTFSGNGLGYDGCVFTVGGMAKGSGMIMPNMATMIAVITTDAPVEPAALHALLLSTVKQTFNKVTVDSDTSTNDTCIMLASGAAAADAEPIVEGSDAFDELAFAVHEVCESLARNIAADGEGASKLVTVNVTGAVNDEEADIAARAVANSPLVKTCIAGHDCNWGRVAMALGKCGVQFKQEDVSIDMMGMPVCRDGLTVPFDEDEALRRFEAPEIVISADLGAGDAATTVWTCDLTHEYISINGDYRS